MEPEGVDLILRQSVELYNLRNTDCYGYGDSKSFSKVNDAYQASSITIKKRVHRSCWEKGGHRAS